MHCTSPVIEVSFCSNIMPEFLTMMSFTSLVTSSFLNMRPADFSSLLTTGYNITSISRALFSYRQTCSPTYQKILNMASFLIPTRKIITTGNGLDFLLHTRTHKKCNAKQVSSSNYVFLCARCDERTLQTRKNLVH